MVYLDVPVDIGQKLIKKRGDISHKVDIHENNISYLKAAQNQYRKLCASNLHWKKIECTQKKEILSREEIAKKVWRVVKNLI